MVIVLGLSLNYPAESGIFKGGDLKPGERHSRDTRDDGPVTLCTLRAATVPSRDCRADCGRPLTKKVLSHSRDGPGATAPLRTHIVPLTAVGDPPPPLPLPPPLRSPQQKCGVNVFIFAFFSDKGVVKFGDKIFRVLRFPGLGVWIGNFTKFHAKTRCDKRNTLIFFSLPFWISLPFSFSRNSLRFWAFFPSSPRILRVRQA